MTHIIECRQSLDHSRSITSWSGQLILSWTIGGLYHSSVWRQRSDQTTTSLVFIKIVKKYCISASYLIGKLCHHRVISTTRSVRLNPQHYPYSIRKLIYLFIYISWWIYTSNAKAATSYWSSLQRDQASSAWNSAPNPHSSCLFYCHISLFPQYHLVAIFLIVLLQIFFSLQACASSQSQ